MKLRLQYRVDTTSLFTDVPGPIEFTSSQSTTDSTEIGPVTLPAICNNSGLLRTKMVFILKMIIPFRRLVKDAE